MLSVPLCATLSILTTTNVDMDLIAFSAVILPHLPTDCAVHILQRPGYDGIKAVKSEKFPFAPRLDLDSGRIAFAMHNDAGKNSASHINSSAFEGIAYVGCHQY